MVVYPYNYDEIGQPIKLQDIEDTIQTILEKIEVNCLALSGGLDSSLMLYFMVEVFGTDIDTYVIGLNEDHPDFVYSKMIAEYFNVRWKGFIPSRPLIKDKMDFLGDEIVREFFKLIKLQGINKIICCDGIDEFMCGYYEHQDQLSEETYYKFLRQLKENHLVPLNKNSGDIEVYLPYLDSNLILLLSQIPLNDKVDRYNRKKIMMEIAKDKIPDEIIQRHKYGFCDAMRIK